MRREKFHLGMVCCINCYQGVGLEFSTARQAIEVEFANRRQADAMGISTYKVKNVEGKSVQATERRLMKTAWDRAIQFGFFGGYEDRWKDDHAMYQDGLAFAKNQEAVGRTAHWCDPYAREALDKTCS